MITKFKNISYFNSALVGFEVTNVYFNNQHICYVGNEEYHFDCEIDQTGRYLIPGLIDIHMHIESSMTTPTEFSNTVLPLGTTTLVADAHEIANVFGLEGLLRFMKEETLLDIFHSIPSSVPSTNSSIETSGGSIDVAEVKTLLKEEKVIALGEVMNYHDVVSPNSTKIKRIIECFKKAKPFATIEGHIPDLVGTELANFISVGISTDHTMQSPKTIKARVDNNVLVQIQEKSITQENIDFLQNLDGKYCFVSDDVMPDHLIESGHLNYCLKLAISLGLSPEKAIYAATYVPALKMNLSDRGVIAPGKKADLIILSDLNAFTIEAVYKNGILVEQKNKYFIIKPEYLMESIKLDHYSLDDFILLSDQDVVSVRAMRREGLSTYTKEVIKEVGVKEGIINWQAAGLCLVAVYNRYDGNQPPAIGFLENGFTNDGAICSSWAHDGHNLIVMGNNVDKMYACLDQVVKQQGGIAIYNQKLEFCPLRYGGIISIEPMPVLAQKLKIVRQSMIELGYNSHNEIMSFAVLTLPVSPELKITDKGYIKTATLELLDWRVK